MTFRDWVEESIEHYRTQHPIPATKTTAWRFWRGVARRTYDPWTGRAIWDRGDWDVLVVMDACRVDQLREMRHRYEALPYEIPAVWSNASASIDWIERNFTDPAYSDEAERTGYVTANPFTRHNDPDTRTADLTDEQVGHLDLMYRECWQDIGNGIETVPPEPMTSRAIDVWRRREEVGIDRLVVHYMQPHEPFRSRPEWGGGDHKLLKNLVSDGATAGDSVYPLLQSGDIGLGEFWRVYQDNLAWVLDDVTERLLTNCDASVVLTADHGNGLGEFGAWHHPQGTIMPSIRRVPWVEVQGVDERTVVPDADEAAKLDAVTAGEDAGEDVTNQLEALGYV